MSLKIRRPPEAVKARRAVTNVTVEKAFKVTLRRREDRRDFLED
jgi:hypothetical protein